MTRLVLAPQRGPAPHPVDPLFDHGPEAPQPPLPADGGFRRSEERDAYRLPLPDGRIGFVWVFRAAGGRTLRYAAWTADPDGVGGYHADPLLRAYWLAVHGPQNPDLSITPISADERRLVFSCFDAIEERERLECWISSREVREMATPDGVMRMVVVRSDNDDEIDLFQLLSDGTQVPIPIRGLDDLDPFYSDAENAQRRELPF
jgi:hypothetical protein